MTWRRRRRPRELVADSVSEWEALRPQPKPAADPFMDTLINNSSAAFGGWYAPANTEYLILPEDFTVTRGLL